MAELEPLAGMKCPVCYHHVQQVEVKVRFAVGQRERLMGVTGICQRHGLRHVLTNNGKDPTFEDCFREVDPVFPVLADEIKAQGAIDRGRTSPTDGAAASVPETAALAESEAELAEAVGLLWGALDEWSDWDESWRPKWKTEALAFIAKHSQKEKL